MGQKKIFLIFLCMFAYFFSACTLKKNQNNLTQIPKDISQILSQRKLALTFVPQDKHMPDYLLFSQYDIFEFNSDKISTAFNKELLLDPLMRRVIFRAEVKRGNKVISKFRGEKQATSVSSANKTTWAPSLQKLVIFIPYIKPGESIHLKTEYEWMDSRWFPALMLESQEPTQKSELIVNAPFGVTTHYQVTKDKIKAQIKPKNQLTKNNLWQRDDNYQGQGNSVKFSHTSQILNNFKKPSDRAQVFVRFKTPRLDNNLLSLDSWEEVSRYLYQKFERYDLPSNTIRDFSVQKTNNTTNTQEKISRLIDFTKTLERRVYDLGFREQIVQPAGKTLASRVGTPFDIAILFKAMLKSLNIDSDIVAVGHRDINPMLTDFFTPILFNTILVAIELENNILYFDPHARNLTLGVIPEELQGQLALKLRERDGVLTRIPYELGEQNQTNYNFDLAISTNGILAGNFNITHTGKDAHRQKAKKPQEQNLLSAQELQDKLFKTEAQIFPWKTATLEYNSPDNIKLSGEIMKRLLSKQANNNYDLDINNIIKPIKNIFSFALNKSYPAILNLNIKIKLPDNTKLNIIPEGPSCNEGNISARLSYNLQNNNLVISGNLLLNQPVQQKNINKIANIFGQYSILDPVLLEENLEMQAQKNYETEKESE